MASFSITFSSSLISLLFYTILFAVPITSYPIDNICKQAKNPDLCFKILRPHSGATLQELGQLVIDQTTPTAARTNDTIQSLLLQTNDPNLRAVCSACSDYYVAALVALNAAEESLKSRGYHDLVSASNAANRVAASCGQAFALAPSTPIPFASDNDNFDQLSNILVIISLILESSD